MTGAVIGHRLLAQNRQRRVDDERVRVGTSATFFDRVREEALIQRIVGRGKNTVVDIEACEMHLVDRVALQKAFCIVALRALKTERTVFSMWMTGFCFEATT
jgi:hypothetical protein